jgi:hypothetical protein
LGLRKGKAVREAGAEGAGRDACAFERAVLGCMKRRTALEAVYTVVAEGCAFCQSSSASGRRM